MQSLSNYKLIPLEAARGIASLVVFTHHFFLGFAPKITGRLPELRDTDSLIGSWYFFLFNGSSAVIFFFALSGFVLCWKPFINEPLNSAVSSLIKRWPRLAFPVCCITFLSFLFFKFNLYTYAEVSALTGSPWLANFADAHWSKDFYPSLGGALIQGLTTFFTGDAGYNTNLWTMRIEFIGSIFVLAMTYLIAKVNKTIVLFLTFLTFLSWGLSIDVSFVPFLVGMYLSRIISSNKIETGLILSLLLLALGLYFLGYLIPQKDYKWVLWLVNLLPKSFLGNLEPLIHTLGAGMVIYAITTNRAIYQRLNGKISLFLGKISFPFYLIHTIIILSIAGSFYKLLYGDIETVPLLIIAYFSTLIVSLLLALPIMWLDLWWIRLLAGYPRKS